MKFCRLLLLLVCFLAGSSDTFSQFSVYGNQQGRTGIINLGDSVNSPYDELSPIISPDGKYLYYGRRNHPLNTRKPHFGDCVDIFFSKIDSIGKWRPGLHMGPPFNQRLFNSVEAMSADGNILYLRGAYKNGHFKGNGISVSYQEGGGWSAPNRMKIKAFKRMNRGSMTNYFVANDGQVLLLSFSRIEGGRNNDIYVSFLNDKGTGWSKPQELNYPINSKKTSDMIPFLASDNETLYFSSDREGGYGKNDIWVSRRQDGTWLNWGDPLVIDTPVNSIDWEGYCTVDARGEYIYFVSNFKSTNGSSDIVKAHLEDRFRPKPVAMVQGKVLTPDRKPLGTLIRFLDVVTNKEYARTISSGIDGSFKIALPLRKQFYIKPESKKYIPVIENVDLRNTKGEYQVVDKDLQLFSISEMKDLLSLKPKELKGATIVKGDEKTELVLSDGRMIPLRIKEGSAMVTLDKTREVGYTYFIPVSDLIGLSPEEIASMKSNPQLKRTVTTDGEVFELASGKKFLILPTEKGYHILPMRPDGTFNKKDNKTLYTNISKTPVLALGTLSSEQQQALAKSVIITNFREDIGKDVFHFYGSDLDFMVTKNQLGIATLLPVTELEKQREIIPMEALQKQEVEPSNRTINMPPLINPQNPVAAPVKPAVVGADAMFMVPLEDFDLTGEEKEELMKKPYLTTTPLSDGSTGIELPNGKKFKIKKKDKGYSLVPNPTPEGYQEKVDPNIVKIPAQKLRGLSQSELDIAGNTLVIGEKNDESGKYEFTLPGGKKYELTQLSEGFLTITPLFSDMSTLLMLNQLDKNFYLGDMSVGETVIIDNLFFDFNKAFIRRESYRSLERLYDLLQASPQTEIMIVGHTDNIGSRGYNVNLSYQRTESVRNYLIERGISTSRIKMYGYGPDRPLTSNNSEDGRQINRRVEFTIMKN